MPRSMVAPPQKYSAIPFWVGFITTFSLGGMMRYLPWQGSVDAHTFVELICVGLATAVGTASLRQYRKRPETLLLILGIGFLGAAVLEALHLVYTSRFLAFLWPDAPVLLHEWTWTIARMHVALVLVWSWLNWLFEYSNNRRTRPLVIIFSGIVACAVCVTVALQALPPRSYEPIGFFHRPGEFWPGFMFAIAFYGYLRKGLWRSTRFEQLLTLSIVLSFTGTALNMSFSANTYDMDYQVAHLVKVISYVVSLMAVISLRTDQRITSATDFSDESTDRLHAERLNAAGFGLASKMAVLAALVALLAGIPTGIVVYATAHEEMLSVGQERLQIEAKSAGEFLRADLEQVKADVSSVVDFIEQVIQSDRDRFLEDANTSSLTSNTLIENSINNILRKNEGYLTLSIVDAAGAVELVRFDRGTEQSVPTAELAVWPESVSTSIRKVLLNPRGTVWMSSIHHIRDAHADGGAPSPLNVVVAPIFGGSQPVAALIMHVDVSQSLTRIRSLFENTDVYITDEYGNLIVLPDTDNPINNTDGKPKRLADIFPGLAATIFSSTQSSASTVEINQTGEQTVVSSYRVAPSDEGSGPTVYVAYSAPRSVIEAAASVIGQKAQVVSNLALGIAVILGWVCAQFLVRPVRMIAEATRGFGRSGEAQDLPVENRDEIGVLARAVDGMMAQIIERQQDLEEEITERARTENAIAVAEARHRAVIESMADAVLVTDEHGITESFNSAAEKMFGYEAEEVLGKPGSVLIPDDSQSEHAHRLLDDTDNDSPPGVGVQHSDDMYCRRKDGTIFPISQRVERFRVNGKIYYSVIIRDLSEQRQAELNLRRLAAAVDATADSIVIMDKTGAIEYANPSYKALTGLPTSEVIGKRPSQLLLGKDDPKHYQEIWERLKTGNSWSGSFASKRGDGRICDDEVSISPVFSTNGSISNFVAVIRDVTEQRALEQQLQQAQKLESIGQLAAGIAHEINTPTQYVGDNTRFLKDAFEELNQLVDEVAKVSANSNLVVPSEKLDAALKAADVEYLSNEIPRAIEQSLDGIDRVSNIVRAMKEFSHPAQDKTLVDLNRAIQSTITVATTEWKYVADIQTDFDPDLPLVPCRPGEFNQVILNLIVNASHAIGDAMTSENETKGTIKISTRRHDNSVKIRIADTGTGMSAEIRKRIFDPFFTTKQVGKGTGQGLSMAHNVIVDKHGGSITVQSQPGHGTTFTLTLPLHDTAAVA